MAIQINQFEAEIAPEALQKEHNYGSIKLLANLTNVSDSTWSLLHHQLLLRNAHGHAIFFIETTASHYMQLPPGQSDGIRADTWVKNIHHAAQPGTTCELRLIPYRTTASYTHVFEIQTPDEWTGQGPGMELAPGLTVEGWSCIRRHDEAEAEVTVVVSNDSPNHSQYTIGAKASIYYRKDNPTDTHQADIRVPPGMSAQVPLKRLKLEDSNAPFRLKLQLMLYEAGASARVTAPVRVGQALISHAEHLKRGAISLAEQGRVSLVTHEK